MSSLFRGAVEDLLASRASRAGHGPGPPAGPGNSLDGLWMDRIQLNTCLIVPHLVRWGQAGFRPGVRLLMLIYFRNGTPINGWGLE